MRTVAAMTAAALGMTIAAPPATAATADERAESRMMSAINEVRAQHGLPAYERSSSLVGSARRYSSWLMAKGVFGHQSTIWASSRFALLGEALSMHSSHRHRVWSTARRWLASPAHRGILLSPVMRRQGAGVTRGRFGSGQATIWVLHVGRLQLAGTNPTLPEIRLP